jgi:hypothetical protein
MTDCEAVRLTGNGYQPHKWEWEQARHIGSLAATAVQGNKSQYPAPLTSRQKVKATLKGLRHQFRIA